MSKIKKMEKIIFENKVVRCYFKSSNGRDLSPERSERIANTITESRKEIEQKDLEIQALNFELAGKEQKMLELIDSIESMALKSTEEVDTEAPNGSGLAVAILCVISVILGMVIGFNF